MLRRWDEERVSVRGRCPVRSVIWPLRPLPRAVLLGPGSRSELLSGAAFSVAASDLGDQFGTVRDQFGTAGEWGRRAPAGLRGGRGVAPGEMALGGAAPPHPGVVIA